MSNHSDDASSDRGQASGRRFIFISDETFAFVRKPVGDDKITGAQIAELAGKHPHEDYVVLHHVPSGELEGKRPNETTKLPDDDQHFFIIKSDGTSNAFYVDGLSMEWPRPSLTAEHMIYLARADGDSEVVIHRGDGPADVYEGDDVVPLNSPGVEKFTTRPARSDITIKVDGELYHPPRRRMTPNEIISAATGQEPSQFYLVRIKRNDERESYQGKGDDEIRLRDGMNFITVSVGPTPVSYPAFERGPNLMFKGLTALGYAPTLMANTAEHVIFDYTVQSGPYAGQTFKLGLIVPPDFPLTWPSGIHLSPELHPLNPSGEHPKGCIHKEHAKPFQDGLGGQWQYWSRPYHHRGVLNEPVQSYLTHIWRLWDTQ
ncbi:hypothetical protein HFO61_31700 [Rhizobium leguminosarum]|uniref:multiubiquitin domain-containing protein n=1 Tax=Rhizobium leguminosarum TaxID=384 RepID=UPI001C9769C6|nr:multiubiquitin domain-containing protein [Rhizobium leguminosarum]MBY5551304.1 hypothetical protein [Rhizobium leguminosarum]